MIFKCFKYFVLSLIVCFYVGYVFFIIIVFFVNWNGGISFFGVLYLFDISVFNKLNFNLFKLVICVFLLIIVKILLNLLIICLLFLMSFICKCFCSNFIFFFCK